MTLKKTWTIDDVIPAPKKPQQLPIILSPEEVIQFLAAVTSAKHRTILTSCYAAGLRISEAIALTPPAIDSKRMVLRVEQGKGKKDRYVMLSRSPGLADDSENAERHEPRFQGGHAARKNHQESRAARPDALQIRL